jgi:hypothetical protein
MLEDLIAHDNQLRAFPAAVYPFTHIVSKRHSFLIFSPVSSDSSSHLYILSALSQVVGCAALNVCDLRNNLLEAVPCELGSLVTMRNLRLDGNAHMAAQARVSVLSPCRPHFSPPRLPFAARL